MKIYTLNITLHIIYWILYDLIKDQFRHSEMLSTQGWISRSQMVIRWNTEDTILRNRRNYFLEFGRYE
jgi:hypothetical protein